MKGGGSVRRPGEWRHVMLVPAAAVLLLAVACSAVSPLPSHPPGVPPAAGGNRPAASFTDRFLSRADGQRFYDALMCLQGAEPGSAGEQEAREALIALLRDYPESCWSRPARACLRLLDECKTLREQLQQQRQANNALRRSFAKELQEQRETNERLRAEQARLGQVNEQLKKDIQLLKELEIQLQRRDRQLR